MNDLVQRLRDSATQARALDRSELLNEAADEIVKIRREVEDLRDTPPQHPAPGECSKPREGTSEPVAWAVMPAKSEYCITLSTRMQACQQFVRQKVSVGYASKNDLAVVALYRSPTLTDAEREAVETCIADDEAMTHHSRAATLRGLLERMK